MRVLVLGGGGREHAICLAAARSPLLSRLFILPGNAGTAELGTNIPGDPGNIDAVLEVARREQIDLTIVGPEDPLAAGIVDAFERARLRIFGPRAAAARLEADKAFAKQLMRQYAIPTAEARIFDRYESAQEYISTRDEPLVVKAAGLARGKGVVVCSDPAEALIAAENMLVKRAFGSAGARIVVEERLNGREVSVLALVNGHTIALLEPAQDYKRLLEGDHGPNTGGMGAYSPAGTIGQAGLRQVESQILVPIVDALVREEIPFSGVLYAGLMLTPAGPKVLEFNCRFGDPETQVLLPRIESDLLAAIDGLLRGEEVAIRWSGDAAVCVVMASAGYPDSVRTGAPIHGLDQARAVPHALVMHAGTRRAGSEVVTSGGRVLGVTGLGPTLQAARESAYAAVEHIRFEGATFRRDIAAGVADSR